jgi:excisionase family DNA binding protein
MQKQLLRAKEQAKLLKVSQTTLREWRRQKIVPFFKVGRVVLYDPARVGEALARFERKELVAAK